MANSNNNSRNDALSSQDLPDHGDVLEQATVLIVEPDQGSRKAIEATVALWGWPIGSGQLIPIVAYPSFS